MSPVEKTHVLDFSFENIPLKVCRSGRREVEHDNRADFVDRGNDGSEPIGDKLSVCVHVPFLVPITIGCKHGRYGRRRWCINVAKQSRERGLRREQDRP